ncbi:MAG: hypothetical protein C0469_17410 [Cyanobacteria bacterium DS2.3.42]|nr:hypothetical protein [Cyanobacteria bacterium DS2.3.42]
MVEARLDFAAPLKAENASLNFSAEASKLFTSIGNNNNGESLLKAGQQFEFPNIPGYDEVQLAALHPPGTQLEIQPSIEAEPPQEQPTERVPEDKLRDLLSNLPANASPEDYAKAEKEVTALLLEQQQNVERANDEYRNYEGIDDLLPQSEEEFDSAYYAVRPDLRNDSTFVTNLVNLPDLLYSGQTDRAQLLMHGLLRVAGTEGKVELQAYFDKLKSIARDNPEIVNEYTGLRNTYMDEFFTERNMLDLLRRHPLNDYIFNK